MKKSILPIVVVVVILILGVFSYRAYASTKIERLGKNNQNIGQGTIELSTSNGSSAQEEIPILFKRENFTVQEVALISKNINANLESYIFVDGKEVIEEKLENTTVCIALKGNDLSPGIHLIEVAQFEGNKKNGDIVTYKIVKYKVENFRKSIKVGTTS